MPGMSGPNLAKVLKGRMPSLKVLLMSGYVDSEGIDASLLEGDSFLQKPFSPDELAGRVRQSLDQGRTPEAEKVALESQ
jgi:DNA-binding NtrC family response regulator